MLSSVSLIQLYLLVVTPVMIHMIGWHLDLGHGLRKSLPVRREIARLEGKCSFDEFDIHDTLHLPFLVVYRRCLTCYLYSNTIIGQKQQKRPFF
jgi:hypothetical protein